MWFVHIQLNNTSHHLTENIPLMWKSPSLRFSNRAYRDKLTVVGWKTSRVEELQANPVYAGIFRSVCAQHSGTGNKLLSKRISINYVGMWNTECEKFIVRSVFVRGFQKYVLLLRFRLKMHLICLCLNENIRENFEFRFADKKHSLAFFEFRFAEKKTQLGFFWQSNPLFESRLIGKYV